MDKVNAKLGTNYQLFNYYGAPDADRVIVAMGSVCDVAEEVIDYLNAHGEKVGLVKVRLYRPFVAEKLVEAIPETVQEDRRARPHQGARLPGRAALPGRRHRSGQRRHATASRSSAAATASAPRTPRPRHDLRRVRRTWRRTSRKHQFTIGIVDDVTNLSLRMRADAPDTAPAGTIECKFWGLGGDGTVGANKNSIKIIGDHTDKYVQAYFQYDSKKTGGVTISPPALRRQAHPQSPTISTRPTSWPATTPPTSPRTSRWCSDVKPGGAFLINCQWTAEELERPPVRRGQALHRQEQHPALHHQRHRSGHRDRHGQAHQHHPAVRLLLSGQGHARRRRPSST